MSPLRDLLGRWPEPSPVSSNSQPNLRASCMAVDSKAVWCISFLGMQPTFTHVPPRPDRHSRAQGNCHLAATTDPDKPCVKSLTKRKYHTPSGSFWCGHNVVQHHDLLPQYSSFLLLKEYILLLCCTVLWSKQKWCK